MAVKAILETPNPSGKHPQWWTKVSGNGKVTINYRSEKATSMPTPYQGDARVKRGCNHRADNSESGPTACPNILFEKEQRKDQCDGNHGFTVPFCFVHHTKQETVVNLITPRAGKGSLWTQTTMLVGVG